MKLSADLLTTEEAAIILKVGAPEVCYLIRNKRLKARKFGRDYFINPEDLKKINYLRAPRR